MQWDVGCHEHVDPHSHRCSATSPSSFPEHCWASKGLGGGSPLTDGGSGVREEETPPPLLVTSTCHHVPPFPQPPTWPNLSDYFLASSPGPIRHRTGWTPARRQTKDPTGCKLLQSPILQRFTKQLLSSWENCLWWDRPSQTPANCLLPRYLAQWEEPQWHSFPPRHKMPQPRRSCEFRRPYCQCHHLRRLCWSHQENGKPKAIQLHKHLTLPSNTDQIKQY